MTGERLMSRNRLGTTLISSPRGRKPDAAALPVFPPPRRGLWGAGLGEVCCPQLSAAVMWGKGLLPAGPEDAKAQSTLCHSPPPRPPSRPVFSDPRGTLDPLLQCPSTFRPLLRVIWMFSNHCEIPKKKVSILPVPSPTGTRGHTCMYALMDTRTHGAHTQPGRGSAWPQRP